MTVRKNRHGRWICDVQIEHADGRVERVRKVAPVQTRREAEAYERELRRAVLDGLRDAENDPEEPTDRRQLVLPIGDNYSCRSAARLFIGCSISSFVG